MQKEELKNRWISILRFKSSEYEHVARKYGKEVTSPSIDDICNEIEAFFTGLDTTDKTSEIIRKISKLNTDEDERLYLTKEEIILLIN